MARRPKPWFRKGRGCFVTIDGKQVSLGNNKATAYQTFHEIMAEPTRALNSRHPLVSTIFDDFLEWTRNHRSAATYDTSRRRLQSFLDELLAGLTVRELKPYHVQNWIDAHPTWTNMSARSSVSTAQRALNWAVKMGYFLTHPIAGFEKPPSESRDRIVTTEEFHQILGQVADEEFADLLTVHWEAGCRPQESLRVETRFVDLKNARWVFPVKKSKGKRKPRIVYLNDTALSITKRHMKKWPEASC